MLAEIKSFALEGIEGYRVDIEVDTTKGVPSFDIVGLPSNSIKEAKNRVRAAIINSCFSFSHFRTTINLAPADVKKDGSQYDFPIALGFLISTEQCSAKVVNDFIILGELSLDGKLRKVNGVMPIVLAAFQKGCRKFLLPVDNAKEASYIEGIEIYPIKNLSEGVAFLGGILEIEKYPYTPYITSENVNRYNVDLADIKGQTIGKRALEIAVAGMHNILLSGPPGTGKTMLAKSVPTIMPKMSFLEALEVTKIHSIAGTLDIEEGIIRERPFRSPHHTASLFSLTGGGAKSMPGEVSLAHNGVLFLDEMPEYPRKTLEALRQPLEDNVITISRVSRTVEYPANFMLIASMNPCPCGNYGSKVKECKCTLKEIRNYHNRISGPLLDRIDINIEVDNIEFSELRSKEKGEASEKVRERIEKAREIQLKRYQEEGIYFNSQLNNHLLKKYCEIDEIGEKLLEQAFRRLRLSARASNRIIKIARTIADLVGADKISTNHLAEAIQYRAEEKSYD